MFKNEQLLTHDQYLYVSPKEHSDLIYNSQVIRTCVTLGSIFTVGTVTQLMLVVLHPCFTHWFVTICTALTAVTCWIRRGYLINHSKKIVRIVESRRVAGV